MAEKMNYSFTKGVNKIPKKDFAKINKELAEYLGCSTMQHYYRRRKCYPNIPAHVKLGVEQIFAKYGIPPSDIWEITPA